jgi:hypothetical protein
LAFSKRQQSFWRFQNVNENAQQTVQTFVTALEAFGKTAKRAVMFGHLRNGQIVRRVWWTFWRFRQRSER